MKIFIFLFVIISSESQKSPAIPLTLNSIQQLMRSKVTVPEGRSLKFSDIIIRYYDLNSTRPISYRVHDVARLRTSPAFDLKKPTVVYAHGYLEYTTDISVQTIIAAYHHNGRYNVLVVDWSNMAFGNYFGVVMDVGRIGAEVGRALLVLVRSGVPRQRLRLVGHSLGAHVLAAAARTMAAEGVTVPRLTGLDPAYPGFYPPVMGTPLSASDAGFVLALHSDGGGYGTPQATAHADFWPNGGTAKQPGCLPYTIYMTSEDFCSHWRSWELWAEAVRSGGFWARRCRSYNRFQRGKCRDEPLVLMGPDTDPHLRGNFYLRTASKAPFALGQRGAD